MTFLPNGSFRLAFSDVVSIPPCLALLALGVRAALGLKEQARVAWLSIALAGATYGLGNVVWTVYEVGFGSDTPFPSIADLGYLMTVPLLMVGVLGLSGGRRTLLHVRTTLDGIILCLAVGGLVWQFILQPIYAESDATLLEKTLSSAYPIGDILLLFALAVSLNQRGTVPRTVILTFGVGAVLFLASDILFTFGTLHDSYVAGSITDYGWNLAFLMMAYAAVLQSQARADYDSGSVLAPATSRHALPLFLLSLTAVPTVSIAFRDGIAEAAPLVGLTAAVGFLLTARQTLTLQDSAQTNRQLFTTARVLEGQVLANKRALSVEHEARTRSERRNQELASVLDSTPDFVLTFEQDGRLLYANEAARTVLGAFAGGNSNLRDLLAPRSYETLLSEGMRQAIENGSWRGESNFLGQDRTEVPVSQVLLSHHDDDGNLVYLSAVSRDISDRKRYESQLSYLASHDGLTDLLNVRRFMEDSASEFARRKRFGGQSALLYLDLDNFKTVNDSRGHHVGDEILARVAGVLRALTREIDLIGRFGGDEFLILLPEANAQQAGTVAARILKEIGSMHAAIDGDATGVTASIGIADLPGDAASADEVVRWADAAMYRAKKSKDSYCIYDAAQDTDIELAEQRKWEALIRSALEGDGFRLVAQPVRKLSNHSTQFELLIRMLGADGELILPAEFLPIAERTGLIHAIDRWVVSQAIGMIEDAQLKGTDLILEVNLSGKAFSDPNLLAVISQRLAESQIPPGNLVFEITETAAVADLNAAQRFIQALRRVGCRFAIDDFGVGFSSFSYLKHLPVDYVKIDGSFIRNITSDAVDQSLVKAMVGMAKALGKQTVAEFVGNQETVDLLKDMGVDYGQGFYLGVPAPLSLFDNREAQRTQAA